MAREHHPVWLVRPQTFMNQSGHVVSCLAKRWKLDFSYWLVVIDDVSLPLGTLRLRSQGSDGGHRGLSSILSELGTQQIPRLRVGIQAESMEKDLTPYVLGRFRPSEKELLEKTLHRVVEACETWITEGLSAAMNLFNQKERGGCA